VSRATRAITIGWWLLAAAGIGRAQEPTTDVLTAAAVPSGTRSPTLDGRLDDAAWRAARPVDDLRQREPLEGVAASERTEVRVVFDATTLYIGVHAFDSDPSAIVARVLERDRIMSSDFDGTPQFGGDDGIALLIDGLHDHRNAMVLATNANGAEFDALITDEGREFNVDWRGIWRVAATRTEDGWSAEFAVPFRSLRYRPGDAEWGFNVYRMIRRKNEEALWQGWTRAGGGFARVSLAGHLQGLAQLPRPRRNIEVRPYALLGNDRERDDLSGAFDDTPRRGIGGELKAQVSSGLVLDATVNTDFAQVEADNVQVNLTRFSLFFPEKREFFLENAGVFEFGARELFGPPPFLMFFSRQVGIAEDGPVPVLGGARLTGRIGDQTVGLLSMVTDSAFDQGRTTYNVLRAKRDIGGNNYIGAMATDRRMGDDYNSVGGVDFSLWPTQALNLQGFAAQTTTAGPGGDGGAQRVAASTNTGRYGFTVQHLRIAPEADAQLGFVTRTDIQQTGGNTRWTWRPRIVGLRTLNWLTFGDYIARLDGALQDWRVANAIDLNWNRGHSVTFYRRQGFTRIDEAFDLADSLPVPAGDFDNNTSGFFASSNPGLPVVLNLNGEKNETFGGALSNISLGLDARAGRHLAFAVNGTRSWVKVPSGRLVADLLSARVSYAFTTQMFLNALVQYSGLDERVSANVRFQYIFRPGSDLFLVLNEERGDPTSLSRLQGRGMRLKVTYLRRL
jgi:Domain of unknown function (DUF5916)